MSRHSAQIAWDAYVDAAQGVLEKCADAKQASHASRCARR
jgi:hypothetical protein